MRHTWPALLFLTVALIGRVYNLACKYQTTSGRVADLILIAFTAYAIGCLL